MHVRYEPSSTGSSLQRRTHLTSGAVTESVFGSYSAVLGSTAKSALQTPGMVDGVRKASSYTRRVTVHKNIPTEWASWISGAYRVEQLNGWGVPLPSLSTFCNESYPPLAGIMSSLKARAETECRARLNKGHVDFGTALGESRTMVRHLLSQGSRLASIVAAIRRKSLGPRKGNIGAYWLEYQYAWRPLLSDIYGTYQLMQEGLASKGQVLNAERTVRETFVLKTLNGSVVIPVPLTVSVNVSLYAKVANSRIAAMRNLGLINPLQVAWEVVPWSFVFDWFVPVGTFLEAATATAGLTFVTGSYTRYVSCEHEYTFEYKPNVNASPAKTRHVLRGISMNRGVYGSFPFPRIYRDRSPFSDQRAVSAMALIGQQLGNRSKRSSL